MAIRITLDLMLARRRMRSNELARRIGITEANLSILKTGRARALRLDTLNAICKALDCQPGELLVYENDGVDPTPEVITSDGAAPLD